MIFCFEGLWRRWTRARGGNARFRDVALGDDGSGQQWLAVKWRVVDGWEEEEEVGSGWLVGGGGGGGGGCLGAVAAVDAQGWRRLVVVRGGGAAVVRCGGPLYEGARRAGGVG